DAHDHRQVEDRIVRCDLDDRSLLFGWHGFLLPLAAAARSGPPARGATLDRGRGAGKRRHARVPGAVPVATPAATVYRFKLGFREVRASTMQTPGLIVAPLTPFTSDLTVDDSALRRQIDYVITDCRATMVVAAGVETQEYTYLGLEQRKALIERTIEFVDGRAPVMVGISHASFRTAVELAHFAERRGAQAVQLLAPLRPFAGPPSQADLIGYFEAIARETRLPIPLYLNPGPGADVSIPDTIALAKLPSVQLIKESSRDLARVSRLIVEIDRAGHARYFTTMQMLLATLELGGSGATMPPPGAEIARQVI